MSQTEKERKIRQIAFPNTVSDTEKMFYESKQGYTFKYIMKAGEMAGIAWIQVLKDDQLIAEIKESVCDIYFI